MDRPAGPEWLDLTTIGSPFEEQLDARARQDAGVERFRHRRRAHTGERPAEWRPGRAPR